MDEMRRQDTSIKDLSFNEIEQLEITIQNSKYGVDRRLSIAYSPVIEELLSHYLDDLKDDSQSKKTTMGLHLTQYFARFGKKIKDVNTLELYQALLRTRLPVFFAERDGKFDGSDWNETEYQILALAADTTEVEAYDNGSSGYKTAIPFVYHEKPERLHLLHCFAPIFKKGSPDYKRIVDENGNIKYIEYYITIRDRLLPELLKYNNYLGGNKLSGIVNIPGIGCGEYAGEFKGLIGTFLNRAIQDILKIYSGNLKNITGVIFDPFNECEGQLEEIGHIKYCVAPSAEKYPKPLLANDGKVMVLGQLASTKERIEFIDKLFPDKWVKPNEEGVEPLTVNPGDMLSGKGCDVVAGHKVTGDGRNVGGTDAMAVHTGVEGIYYKYNEGTEYSKARYSRYKSLKDEEEDQGYGTIFLEKRDELLLINEKTVERIDYDTSQLPDDFNINSSDALYLMRLYKQSARDLMDKIKKLSEAKDEKRIELKKQFLVDALKLDESTLAILFDPRLGCDKSKIIDYLYDQSERNLDVFLDCSSFLIASSKENIAINNQFTDKIAPQLMPFLTHFQIWKRIAHKLASISHLFFEASHNQQPSMQVYEQKYIFENWGSKTSSKLISPMDARVIATLLQYSHQTLFGFNHYSYDIRPMSRKLYDCLFAGSETDLYIAVNKFNYNDAAEQYYEYCHIIGSDCLNIVDSKGNTQSIYRIYLLAPDDIDPNNVNNVGQKKCNKLVEFLFYPNNHGSFDIKYAEKRLETAQEFKNQISRVVVDLSKEQEPTKYLFLAELSPYMKDYEVKYQHPDTERAYIELQNMYDDQLYRENYEKIFREEATEVLQNIYYYHLTLDTTSNGFKSYQESDAPGKDVFIQHIDGLVKEKISIILQEPMTMWHFLLTRETLPIARKAEQAAQELCAITPIQGRGAPIIQNETPKLKNIGLYKEEISIKKLGMDVPLQSEWKKAGSFIAWLNMNGISWIQYEDDQKQIRLNLHPKEEENFIKTWGCQFNILSVHQGASSSYVSLNFHQWEQLKQYYVANIQNNSNPEEQLFYRGKLLNELGTTFDLLDKRKGVIEQNLGVRGSVSQQNFHALAIFKRILNNHESKNIDQEAIDVFKQYIRVYLTLNYGILSSQQIDALTQLSNNKKYPDDLINIQKKTYNGFLELIDIMFEEASISNLPNYNLLITDLKAQLPQYQNYKELIVRLRTFSEEIGDKVANTIKESLLKKQKINAPVSNTIHVKQYERDAYDYIYMTKEGEVSIFAPVLRGHMIGTDNTCHAKDEFYRFVGNVQSVIKNAIDDISQDINILESTRQSETALHLKRFKKANLEKWHDYFKKTPLDQGTLYDDIKKKFAQSNVVTALQHPYSKDNYLNLGILPPHHPSPEPGYTSAFYRGDTSCAVELFQILFCQPKKQGLLEKIKSSVLAQYHAQYNTKYDTKFITSQDEIEELKKIIINVLDTEYHYNNSPKFKMNINLGVEGGKFSKGISTDVTYKNIITTLGFEDSDPIGTEDAFNCLLNESQEDWDNISFEIRNRNLFLTEDWKKFGVIAQFYVNSLVALYTSKGGEKFSLGKIIEDKHRDAFIQAVVNAYNGDISFVDSILEIVKPYLSNENITITQDEAYKFFYQLFQVIDGSMHYDDFLLLTNNIKNDRTNFVTLKSKISVNMRDLNLCPDEFKKNDKLILTDVNLESENSTKELIFDLNPENYLNPEKYQGKTQQEIAEEIASFLLLDTKDDTKVWKVVSDAFMAKLAKRDDLDLILKVISQNPYISASQRTAILQRLGITDILNIDKQMFTWLYNICLIKNPEFLYEVCNLKPSEQLFKILKELGCCGHASERPVGPDKDGSFSARCQMAKMRNVIADAIDSRDCLYLHQAFISSIYKHAYSMMTESERHAFDQLSPKNQDQIDDNSKLMVALKYIFSGSKYNVQPDCPPYNTCYKKDRILVKMHSKFGYVLHCANHDILLQLKDELDMVHERTSRFEFDEQIIRIMLPGLTLFTAQNIQRELDNSDQGRNKIFTLSEVSVLGENKCVMSLDRDNLALLIHRALTEIRKNLPFTKNIRQGYRNSGDSIKENYFHFLESSFINSLYPFGVDGLTFARNNRSKTSEELYKEFIEPINQFQEQLEKFASEEVLDRTIFIDPVDVESILNYVERSKNKEELYRKFTKKPNEVMLDALLSLSTHHLDEIDLRRDISHTNQLMCYKPISANTTKDSCAIVCKSNEEYTAINQLIQKVKEEGKRFIFHRDDILLLLGEQYDCNLTNKALLIRLKERYNSEWENVDEEYFLSAPLKFDNFMELAFQAYNNNHLLKHVEENILSNSNINYKPIINYYNWELTKNERIIKEFRHLTIKNYADNKYIMRDIYHACFVKNREVLRQLDFFLTNKEKQAIFGGGYVNDITNDTLASMAPAEREALRALQINGSFLGSDPKAFLMIANKIFPDKKFYAATEENLRQHKNNGYFCMILPHNDPKFISYMYFQAPTASEASAMDDRVMLNVLKTYFVFDGKMKKVLEIDPKGVSYIIQEDGKVKMRWTGNEKGREEIANTLSKKFRYYDQFVNNLEKLHDVTSDKFSLIYQKYYNRIKTSKDAMSVYTRNGYYPEYDHYSGKPKQQDKYTCDVHLTTFFKNANAFVTIVEEAQEEMQAVLKQIQIFNFSNRDIFLFLGLTDKEEIGINENQIIKALNLAKIHCDYIGKTANGWEIQFDRNNFVQFIDRLYQKIKQSTITKAKEFVSLDKELNQYLNKSNEAFENESLAQSLRKNLYDRFIHYPKEMSKNEIFDLIAAKDFENANKKIAIMPELLIERDEQDIRKRNNTPILAALSHTHPENNKDDKKVTQFLSFCHDLINHPDIRHLEKRDANGNTLLHKAIFYRHKCIVAGRISAAQEFTEFAYHLLDKVPDLAYANNQFGEGVYGKDNEFDEDDSFKAGYKKIHQLFQALDNEDDVTVIESIFKNDPHLINQHSGNIERGNPTALFSLMYRIVHTSDITQQLNLKNLVMHLIDQHQEMIEWTKPSGGNNTLLHFAFYHPILADIALFIVEILAKCINSGINPLKVALNTENIDGETVFDSWVMGYHKAMQHKLPEKDLLPYKTSFSIILETNSAEPKQLSKMQTLLPSEEKKQVISSKQNTKANPITGKSLSSHSQQNTKKMQLGGNGLKTLDFALYQQIVEILKKGFDAYLTPSCSNHLFKKTFDNEYCKTIKNRWKRYYNHNYYTPPTVTTAIRLIYWQLDRALVKRDSLTSNPYYGQFEIFHLNGKMIPILEQVKDTLEREHREEAEIYKIIYTEFQKYLNPTFSDVSGTFTYNDIFGAEGFAQRIFDNYCQDKNSLSQVIEKCKDDAIDQRIKRWSDRKPKDQRLNSPENRSKSDMIKALSEIESKLGNYELSKKKRL